MFLAMYCSPNRYDIIRVDTLATRLEYLSLPWVASTSIKVNRKFKKKPFQDCFVMNSAQSCQVSFELKVRSTGQDNEMATQA